MIPMRTLGFASLALGFLAILGELKGIAFPTAHWFFATSHEIPWLHTGSGETLFPWFGWLSSAILLFTGGWIVIRSFTKHHVNPVTLRRIRRFREIKRGYYSLVILIALGTLAALDQTVVGKRALAVQHNGEWTFPAFLATDLKYRHFGGLPGESDDAPVNYRTLKRAMKESGRGKVLMPFIPYDPTGDTLPARSRPLSDRGDGILREGNSSNPFSGLAARYHDVDQSRMHIRFPVRNGRFAGPAEGWDAAGNPVYTAAFENGDLVSDNYTGPGEKEDFLAIQSSPPRAVKHHPAPPLPETRNWLGTTSQGYDVLSYLYGGLQVNFKAAIIFLPIVYFIGVVIGMLCGFYGGWFDLLMQRLIEIFSNMPFLFVVIILSSMVPDHVKGLPVILTILVLFGWMDKTSYMRTAVYRDKERDYIHAARVLGASTPRILFRHLLPNTVSIIVTLVPFTMSGLIFALTSLDYLGFGLPPQYATWGRLLNDGLQNLSAPWLVTSTFIVLVGLLVLITFIGEAVREAFDPKKFTYYR
ncbi:MAG: ABC transporter permease subunit [Verrucomicrobiota bacterium]